MIEDSAQKHLIVVGYGPITGYKYSRFISEAIDRGAIRHYSIVDLQSQEGAVLQRIKGLAAQPEALYFIADAAARQDSRAGLASFDRFVRSQVEKFGADPSVVIATEPQAHESYLRYCIDRNIDSLVTKPIVLPMRDGRFDPSRLTPVMAELVRKATAGTARHAVLCFGRCHEIFEHGVRAPIQAKMDELGVPITSIHLKTSAGVWNMPREFQSRDDHPYKYGYGMLMHGAYHYIDLVAQLLKLNTRIYPDQQFVLDVSSYAAGPRDQSLRIPHSLSQRLAGFAPELLALAADESYGETDIVSTFCLRSKSTDQVLTIGTFGLEQTTPGMRSWSSFPDVPYNINGRLHCTDLDVRLATVFAINGHVVKIPIAARQGATDVRGRNVGRITTRANALIVGSQEFHHEEVRHRPYGNSFSYSAERDVFADWLAGAPAKSSLESHLPSVALLQALAESRQSRTGHARIDF